MKLGQTVYHKSIYDGREPLKVVGLRESEVELEGDYSGGTHNVCQRSWLPIDGVLLGKGKQSATILKPFGTNENACCLSVTGSIEFRNSSGHTTTAMLNQWGTPERIEVREVGESIEMVYIEKSLITPTTLSLGLNHSPSERVFKIVYSCVDGKWNKSERIYGKIIPAQNEYYEFD